jgi:flagellar protein FlaG
MISPAASVYHDSRPAPQSTSVAAVLPVAEASGAKAIAAQSPQAMRQAVKAINEAAKSLNSSVQFSLDNRASRPIVRVVDTETGQLIRQIPSEEVLALREALDRIVGLLINHTA